MKVVLVQSHILWEEKERNIEKAIKVVEEQAQAGAELILFPEMSFTGFSMNTALTKEGGRYTQGRIAGEACKHNVSIGFGWVRDCGEKCENHYSVIDNTGIMISDYAKIHPFSYSGEDQFFVGGEKTTIFQLNGIKFSTFVCYDLRFPEVFQAVSDEVSVIVVPANWPARRCRQWKTLLQARAIENQVYILGVNCVGNIGGTEYSGDCCVVNPNGDVIVMESGQEGILSYDLEDDVEKHRESFQVRKDRKWRLYQKLYANVTEG